jgi:AraC family transcriptional regulator
MHNRTAQNHELRILKVLAYIESRLDQPLPTKDLSRVASFSRFHFHRIFQGATGETVAEMVRRIRLHRAAIALRQSTAPVSVVSSDADYESAEAFARAFKRFSNFAPRAYRNLALAPTLSQDAHKVRYCATRGHITLQPTLLEINMNVEIATRPSIRYAYIRHVDAYTNVGSVFNRLFHWAGEQGLLGPDTQRFSLSYDDAVATAKLRSDACLSLPAGTNPSTPEASEVAFSELPEGRFAQVLSLGPYDQITNAYQQMFGQWLPGSGEQVADFPCIEFYLNNSDETPAEDLRTMLCVPLAG